MKSLSFKCLVLMAFTMGIFMTFASAQNSLSLPNTNTQSTISKFKDCSVCPEMVALPSGEFQMGANEEDWKIISSMDKVVFGVYVCAANIQNRVATAPCKSSRFRFGSLRRHQGAIRPFCH